MKLKRLFTITLIVFFAFASLSVSVYADPEEEWSGEGEEWVETEETYVEPEPQEIEYTYNEDGEAIYYDAEAGEWKYYYGDNDTNQYSGEYSEGYDEQVALETEEAWQADWSSEEGAWVSNGGENTDSEKPDEEEEGEKEYETPPPIVAEDGTVRQPVITSTSAAVYCRNTGELVFAKNATKRMSPYSITKLLTSLLAVQKLPLNQVVTVSEEAASQDGSTMDLSPGEEVTVEQLLYGTMILSGNDAAYALAEAVSGNVDDFVALMNETASYLGCKNTHFVNPNGLTDDASQQYTSAKDFIEICKLAFSNETLRKIAGANEYDMPETNFSEAYKMEGHNELLLDGKKGYVAGKTGYWEDTKATIAMDYVEGSLELIVVALGGDVDKRASDCDQLIEYATASIEGLKIVSTGEMVSNVRVRRGAVNKVEALTAGDSFIYLPKQASKELIQLVAVLDEDLTAPVKAGDNVGTYQVFLGEEKLDEVPLVAAEDVEEGWILSYFGISNQATLVMGGLISLLILLIIIRSMNKAKQRRLRSKGTRKIIRDE